jgi:carbonic anhydrase
MISVNDALESLKTGNRRFAAGETELDISTSRQRRDQLVSGQAPFAVILGCSDSRVPVEMIFDQGLGDLFVIRVAGNVVAPSQVGSVEFAAEQFGVRLVVVLGHTGCGAIAATLKALQEPGTRHSENLHSIVERIGPAVEGCLAEDSSPDDEQLIERAVRANIRASVQQLQHGSSMIEEFVRDDGLVVVGAEYSLATGTVEFLDT